MCGRFNLFSLPESVKKHFNLSLPPEIRVDFNIHPGGDILAIMPEAKAEHAKRRWKLSSFTRKERQSLQILNRYFIVFNADWFFLIEKTVLITAKYSKLFCIKPSKNQLKISFTCTFKKFLRCEINRSNNVLTMYIYCLKLLNGYPLWKKWHHLCLEWS